MAFQGSEGLLADGIVGARTASALGLAQIPEVASAIPAVKLEIVCQMFPSTPVINIQTHLPIVLNGLAEAELGEKPMVLMALATIRAETEAFLPISEAPSQFNTSPRGRPFDLYDNRRDLGNMGPPDGERFRGRGFIQLTGRVNYLEHGRAIGLGERLIEEPELANDPVHASKLLASFLKRKELRIKQALLDGDLAGARRLVNGGRHGLERFMEAYNAGNASIPDALAAGARA
jgi:peptidoglycan L-alanyl-D-glutamate endopeptidase CwlK